MEKLRIRRFGISNGGPDIMVRLLPLSDQSSLTPVISEPGHTPFGHDPMKLTIGVNLKESDFQSTNRGTNFSGIFDINELETSGQLLTIEDSNGYVTKATDLNGLTYGLVNDYGIFNLVKSPEFKPELATSIVRLRDNRNQNYAPELIVHHKHNRFTRNYDDNFVMWWTSSRNSNGEDFPQLTAFEDPETGDIILSNNTNATINVAIRPPESMGAPYFYAALDCIGISDLNTNPSAYINEDGTLIFSVTPNPHGYGPNCNMNSPEANFQTTLSRTASLQIFDFDTNTPLTSLINAADLDETFVLADTVLGTDGIYTIENTSTPTVDDEADTISFSFKVAIVNTDGLNSYAKRFLIRVTDENNADEITTLHDDDFAGEMSVVSDSGELIEYAFCISLVRI